MSTKEKKSNKHSKKDTKTKKTKEHKGKEPENHKKKDNIKRHTKYSTFIRKVLSQVHPDNGISGDAMSEMNNLVNILLERIMHVCNLLTNEIKHVKTVDSRAVQAAIRLVLPGELAKHAVSEGTKAVTKYNGTISESEEKKGKGKKSPHTKSFRAGLQFPVSRIGKRMKTLSEVDRLGAGASVYLAAVLEYITAEILELSGNATRDLKKTRINLRHITLAIGGDEELSLLFKNVTLNGGVIPHIHKELLKRKTKGKKKVDQEEDESDEE